jgi:hypothetical protein
MTTTELPEIEYTPEQIEDCPILNDPQRRYQLLEIIGPKLANYLLRLEDIVTAIHLIDSIYDHHPMSDTEFIEAYRRFWGFARESRALELGVSTRTIENWMRRWGLQIVRPGRGDQFLYSRLGMLERKNKSTKQWMRKFRMKTLNKEPR